MIIIVIIVLNIVLKHSINVKEYQKCLVNNMCPLERLIRKNAKNICENRRYGYFDLNCSWCKFLLDKDFRKCYKITRMFDK